MTANYCVRRTAKATVLLRGLPKCVRSTAEMLALRLGALVVNHPERIYQTVDRWVYQHPDPLIEIEYTEGGSGVYDVTGFRAPLPPRVLVFISYSHRDEKFRVELCKYLGRLHEAGQVSFWHDKKDIAPGTDWAKAIQNAIKRSSAALLLVTQDFIDSRFIRDMEIPMVEARLKSDRFDVFWIPIDETTIQLDIPWICARQNFNIEKPLSLLSKPLRKQELSRFCTKFRLHLEALSTAMESAKSKS